MYLDDDLIMFSLRRSFIEDYILSKIDFIIYINWYIIFFSIIGNPWLFKILIFFLFINAYKRFMLFNKVFEHNMFSLSLKVVQFFSDKFLWEEQFLYNVTTFSLSFTMLGKNQVIKKTFRKTIASYHMAFLFYGILILKWQG